MSFRVLALSVVLLGSAALAGAQQPLRLQIAGGRVTLHAENVPVRTILAEWSRLGGARILNGDRVVGPPVTLDLENVPERQALDIILRGVSGFMLAAREPGAAGASMFDRIMILPTSNPPRNPPPAAASPIFSNAPAAMTRPVAPRVSEEQDADNTDAGNDVPLGPRPIAVPRPVQAPGTPVFQPLTPIGNQEPAEAPAAQPPGVVVTPSNPFGLPPGSSARPGVITSSARPGVITPVPPSPQQTPPRQGPQN